MKEFDYKLDYKQIDFKKPENRKLYRIGRGEQGVLLVRPYTDIICCLLYTSPSPRDRTRSRMPSSA